jgi:hypothetical protein
MIKLEDLKVGDKIFKINKYYWCKEIEVTEEMREFEYQDLSKSTVYVVVGKSLEDWGMHREQLFYYDEVSLFRTEVEAKEQMKLHRDKQKEEWSDKNVLIKYLCDKVQSALTKADKELINEIISNDKRYKDLFNLRLNTDKIREDIFINDINVDFLKELGSDKYYDFLELMNFFIKSYIKEEPRRKDFTLSKFAYTLEDHLY